MSFRKKYEICPPNPNYFKDLPIQPGSTFFRSLIGCKYPLNTLYLNIPHLFYNDPTPILLYTGNMQYIF